MPIEEAAVFGTWSEDVTGNASRTTSGGKRSASKVTFGSDTVTGGGTFTFTVTDVVISGSAYDPNSNIETSDSVTVP